jgi:hypothetical protein
MRKQTKGKMGGENHERRKQRRRNAEANRRSFPAGAGKTIRARHGAAPALVRPKRPESAAARQHEQRAAEVISRPEQNKARNGMGKATRAEVAPRSGAHAETPLRRSRATERLLRLP